MFLKRSHEHTYLTNSVQACYCREQQRTYSANSIKIYVHYPYKRLVLYWCVLQDFIANEGQYYGVVGLHEDLWTSCKNTCLVMNCYCSLFGQSFSLFTLRFKFTSNSLHVCFTNWMLLFHACFPDYFLLARAGSSWTCQGSLSNAKRLVE